jgi:hypothetical protein
MFSLIRRRFTYANVAMTIALVFAMTGGAYAAKHWVISSTKQIKPSVLAQLKGKNGANGANGALGASGPAGKDGTNGVNGKDGTNGVNGKDGVPGERGPEGKEGSPWTAGGTLPSEKTEMGDWSLIAEVKAFGRVASAVSFGIPLSEAPTPHYIRVNGMEPYFDKTTGKEAERTPAGCPGSAANPEAEPGNLCVYASHEENTETNPQAAIIDPVICSFASPEGDCSADALGAADKYGFGVATIAENEGKVNITGTWAVAAS